MIYQNNVFNLNRREYMATRLASKGFQVYSDLDY